ncbi:MAG: ABC transporter permease [Pseudomonadota bacterium]
MQLQLERRVTPSFRMMLLSPLIAVGLTLATGAIIFASLGKDPLAGLYFFFFEPLTVWWSFEEVLVKMTPLALIAAGLTICFLANVWNIGAEGQFIFGAIIGAILPVLFPELQGYYVLPIMLLMGFLGGMAYGLVPALFKVRFGANEILTSLMLVYVAELFLDWLVRGPWRNPGGLNFPETRQFHEFASMPIIGDDRLNIGFLIAVAVSILLFVFLTWTFSGFGVRLSGNAPKAAKFAGFDRNKTTYFVLGLSGALAGLAGIIEVAGPIDQLRPAISPGYGFTAIIVAFLGRLNPIGTLVAAFVLSITYIGGESAQITIGVTDKITRVFQGILLFYVLACDTLIVYRLRLRRATPPTMDGSNPQEASS